MAFRDLRTRPERAAAAKCDDESTSFIDASCELSGKLHFCESVQIDGQIEGRIDGEKAVIIGPSGRVHADITGESIEISGQVEGDIRARRQITFRKGAQVIGQLAASSLVVEEGSRFKGCIEIGETPLASAAPREGKPAAQPPATKQEPSSS